MANLAQEPLLDLPRPRIEELDSSRFKIAYNKKHDTLFIRGQSPRPATSVDLGGEMWVRIDPQTGEILGFEIEDFERVFLARHADIASAWHEATGRRHHVPQQRESLLAILISLFRQFLDVHPQQQRFCAT